MHPLNGESVGDDVDFVHGDDEGEFVFVEDGAGVKHVGHESDRIHGSRSVHHVNYDRRKYRSQSLSDDGPGDEMERGKKKLAIIITE